jgi:hypothetical protein
MALEFDGATQYIQVAQTKDLPIYNETTYSVCGWVKAPAQDDKRIFAEGSSASNNPLLTIGSGRTTDSTTNKLQVYIRNDAGTALLGAYGTKSTTAIFDDAWHHFCWNDNNGTAELYIDSVKDATNFNYTRSGTLTLNRTGIAAVIRAAVSNWLDGELFDIRCYNRCLTLNEIAEIYHKRGADRVCQGLVGQWRMDELPSGTPAPLLLDSMDSTTGWSASGGVVSLNTTTHKEGSGALSLSKTATDKKWASVSKTISSVNLTGQTLKLWIYIKDSTTLSKTSRIEIYFGQGPGTANSYFKQFVPSNVGWNLFSAHVDDFTVAFGSPTKTNVNYIQISPVTVNNGDTLSADDIIFDFFRAGDYPYSGVFQVPDLSGNGNHGTPYNSPVYQTSPHRLRRGVLVS